MQKSPPQQEPIPHALVFHFNEYGQLRVKTRLVLTAPEIAELSLLTFCSFSTEIPVLPALIECDYMYPPREQVSKRSVFS